MSEPSDTPASFVLVVDDDVLVRNGLATYLRHCGYGVIEAASSDEALIVLGEAGLDIDIVLCDAQLPGTIGGFGLQRWVREHRSDIAFELAGSVAAAADAAAEICENGPQLARPYEPQSVVDRIKQLRAESERQRALMMAASSAA